MLAVFTLQAQKIEIAELPNPSLTFIEKYFPGVPVLKAKKDGGREKGYEVALSNGVEIEFKKDGAYREVDGNGKPIPTSFISPKIVSYVNKHYPKRKIIHIDEDQKGIDVALTGKLQLEFSKDGTFVKGKKDK